MSKGTPKPNRLIKCQGHDWSPFTCVGMWVPYKSPPNRNGTGRFMMQDQFGNWNAAKETWKDVESWEYVDSNGDAETESGALRQFS